MIELSTRFRDRGVKPLAATALLWPVKLMIPYCFALWQQFTFVRKSIISESMHSYVHKSDKARLRWLLVAILACDSLRVCRTMIGMVEQGSVVRFGNSSCTVLRSAQAPRVVQLCRSNFYETNGNGRDRSYVRDGEREHLESKTR